MDENLMTGLMRPGCHVARMWRIWQHGNGNRRRHLQNFTLFDRTITKVVDHNRKFAGLRGEREKQSAQRGSKRSGLQQNLFS